MTGPVYLFCPYVDTKTSQRCVSGPHAENWPHDLQPRASLTVRTIERQEQQAQRLGYDREVTVSEVLDAVDAAIEAPPQAS